jgi:hypothetical protein
MRRSFFSGDTASDPSAPRPLGPSGPRPLGPSISSWHCACLIHARMPPSIPSRLLSSSKGRGSLRIWAPSHPGRASPTSRQLWLAVAVGSVALLLLAARHRRRSGAAGPRPTRVPMPRGPDGPGAKPLPAHAPDDEARPASVEPHRSSLANAAGDATREAPAAPADRFVCRIAPYSIELPLPAVHRAALAISLGKPAALRRLARDLQRIGQDIEAGLLENYAVLLERSNPDRNRLLAEVTRMLRAAAAERRSARRTSPAIPWPPTGRPALDSTAPGPALSTPTTAPRSEADTEGAHESRAVVPLPLVTVDARRRASR